MPRWLKVVIWFVVFAACAGAGAYVASRTDPFPPGVEDPGARQASPSSPTPTPASFEHWEISIESEAVHTFRVGGACRTSWEGEIGVSVGRDTGSALGRGSLFLVEGPVCDFPVDQVQAERLRIRLRGSRSGARLTFVPRVVDQEPSGSNDLGGAVDAIHRMTFEVEDGVPDEFVFDAPDGVGGAFRVTTVIGADCLVESGCE